MGKTNLLSRLVGYARIQPKLATMPLRDQFYFFGPIARGMTHIMDERVGPFVSCIPVVIESEAKQASWLRKLLGI